ncbi:hypothetical protein KCP76_23180 [Salmonella enterica subsp. enterica serovar Weltevreden]|nr:hypothetical protein KCP76_23180 [Salmonella enterica subsp. enterica serovar Weltevreden]
MHPGDDWALSSMKNWRRNIRMIQPICRWPARNGTHRELAERNKAS